MPKQSHFVSPAFEFLCSTSCGPVTNKFRDPCCRLMVNSMKTSFAQQRIVATPLANHMK